MPWERYYYLLLLGTIQAAAVIDFSSIRVPALDSSTSSTAYLFTAYQNFAITNAYCFKPSYIGHSISSSVLINFENNRRLIFNGRSSDDFSLESLTLEPLWCDSLDVNLYQFYDRTLVCSTKISVSGATTFTPCLSTTNWFTLNYTDNGCAYPQTFALYNFSLTYRTSSPTPLPTRAPTRARSTSAPTSYPTPAPTLPTTTSIVYLDDIVITVRVVNNMSVWLVSHMLILTFLVLLSIWVILKIEFESRILS